MASSQGGKQRVLVVSASAGNGHTRAGEALLAAFQTHPAVSHVEHWDLLHYSAPPFRWLYSQGYAFLAAKVPRAFGYLYSATDTPWKHESPRLAVEKFGAGKFYSALGAYQPDLIVSTHFTPPFLLSAMVDEGRLAARSAIVITDFDVHATWLVRNYERYFCMLDHTRAYLEKMGIDPARITVSGIPLSPAFNVAKDKLAMRAQFGLESQTFTLLLSAGGVRPAFIEEMLKELFTLKMPLQIICVAGKSAETKNKVDALARRSPATIRLVSIGYTTQMDEYMAAADLLISKPGGLTASEALARGLPMCIIHPIPGQEERNADFLLEAGAAIRCTNLQTFAYKLERLATAGELDSMRAKARTLGKPDASQVIVNTLMSVSAPAAHSA